MRQLLDVLVALLPSFDADKVIEIRNETLQLVFKILLSQSDHVKVKPAFQIMSAFLSKETINLDDFALQLRVFVGLYLNKDTAPRSNRVVLQGLAEALIKWMRFLDAAPAAGQTFCALVKLVQSQSEESNPETEKAALQVFWIEPLISSFSAFPDAAANLRHHLLPDLFALNFSAYVELLEKLGLHSWLEGGDRIECNALDTQLLYTCLQVGKETGLVLDAGEWDGCALRKRYELTRQTLGRKEKFRFKPASYSSQTKFGAVSFAILRATPGLQASRSSSRPP